MKKINLLLILLTLTSCNLNTSKGYEFAHLALDSLLDEVSYDESIEVKNALYHKYDKDSNLNEVVVMYFTYEHSEYGLMDEYLKYEYDEENMNYVRYARGKEQTDWDTEEAVATKNIIITSGYRFLS